MRARVARHEGFELEVRYYDRWGHAHWMSASCEPVVEPGQPMRFVMVLADLTERKGLEERLTRAESVGQMGHWTLDPHSGAIDWSYETFRIFGFDPAGGIPPLDEALTHYHPEDAKRIAQIIEDAVATGTGFSFRARLQVGDIEKVVEVIGECERGEDGTARRFFGIIQDITAGVRREEALTRALERAEAANRVKSEFLATMSHELRTPLNAIAGYSEIMAQRMFGPLGNPRYEGYARDIHGSALYLRELIEGVLELSSVEAERKALSVEAVEARGAVETVVALVGPTAQAAGVDLVNAVPADLYLASDRRALKQVMINCVENAVKFSPRGAEVALGASLEGEAVRLTIADRGCGIPAEHLEKVIEPFYRAHTRGDAAVASVGGTGIGLALVHRYMLSMNGRLEIDSREGEGTTISLIFPLSPAAVAAPSPPSADPAHDTPPRSAEA
jgi:signal transduction histidine kinase